MALWIDAADPVELRPQATESDLQIVIQAVYKQILGNAHLLESDRLIDAESKLRNGDITVRGFVEQVAKSDLYRSLFFESASQYRFIELNCKHFLGRAPLDQAEISNHVQLYKEQGYDAEIESYIHSDEYSDAFGENTVPYPRNQSQVGLKNVTFNRTFALNRGFATSDNSNKAALISDIASNRATKIDFPTKGGGRPGNTSKRFRVVAAKSGAGMVVRQANLTYEVSYENLSRKIQSISKTGGKILSITQI
ncbi:MAG: phycobilisome rod-core linker polypeptide [Cyanobacteria bacterium J06592_8]